MQTNKFSQSLHSLTRDQGNWSLARKKAFILLFFNIDFRDMKGEGEKERNIYKREKHRLAASCMTPTEDWAHNLGTCPDQNRTGELWVHGIMLNQLSQTSQARQRAFRKQLLHYWPQKNSEGTLPMPAVAEWRPKHLSSASYNEAPQDWFSI